MLIDNQPINKILKQKLFPMASLLLAVSISGAVSGQTHSHDDGTSHSHAPGYHKDIRGDYAGQSARWWKGNTHTHSWWSDGDSPPEIAAAWYREHDYDFLVLSDHNIMQQGALRRGNKVQYPTFWYTIETEQHKKALATYRRHFGNDWVETREKDGKTEVRLKTLNEFRHLFEAPGEFVFVPGEEITTRFESHPVHMNGVNIQSTIAPRDGNSVLNVMQNNLDAVLDHGRESGREVLAHLNHPNFHYAITVEDMVGLEHADGEGFFEVYNGHHGVENYGDNHRSGTERMWDIVLAKRLAEGKSPIYGIATDDAHNFAAWEIEKRSNPGRGWVMVRSTRLTPDFIVAAMKRGDFYNSTGVVLRDLQRTDDQLVVTVEPEEGVEYTIEFVGTERDVNLQGQAPRNTPADVDGRFSMDYSDDIGKVLKRVKDTTASYQLSGDEFYVRARIVSNKDHPHGYRKGDKEMAWTQPLMSGDK